MKTRYIVKAVCAGGYQYNGVTLDNGAIAHQTGWYYSLSSLIGHNEAYVRTEIKTLEDINLQFGGRTLVGKSRN